MPIRPIMKSAESLSALYDIILKLAGHRDAHMAVTTALSSVIYDIKEEGLSVTPDLIDKKLEIYVKDFIEVAEKTNVA